MKKNLYWRFSRKIEGEFWIFYKRFPWKKIEWKKFLKGFLWKIEAGGKFLKGYPLIHTHASLARAVFSFKTFFDPRYCEWSEVSEWSEWSDAFLVLYFSWNLYIL